MANEVSLIDVLSEPQAARLDKGTEFEIRALEQRMPIIDESSRTGWVHEITMKLRLAAGFNIEYSEAMDWYTQQGFFQKKHSKSSYSCSQYPCSQHKPSSI